MSKHLDTAVEAAKECGKILKAYFHNINEVFEKDAHDLVSTADYASEARCLQILKKEFPDYTYIAEEAGIQHTHSPFAWYIDPLDGTMNYLSGDPYFSVSIALAEQGNSILGVVYNPMTEELFTAEKGQGSFLNGKPIKTSHRKQMQEALISMTYALSAESLSPSLTLLETCIKSSRRVFIRFSPALDLCNIACGRLDALIQRGTTPEDHAAGCIILTEAGGTIENYAHTTWQIDTKGVIATNGILHQEVIQLIRNPNIASQ